jgi:hypothetical protein
MSLRTGLMLEKCKSICCMRFTWEKVDDLNSTLASIPASASLIDITIDIT